MCVTLGTVLQQRLAQARDSLHSRWFLGSE